MNKAYKFRLYPNNKQRQLLQEQLDEMCRLYNGAVEERRSAWKHGNRFITFFDQVNQLKPIRDSGDVILHNFHSGMQTLRRVDLAFRAFFKRVKQGEAPGYPRFRSRTRFDSYTYQPYGDGVKIEDTKHLRLQGIGSVKIIIHREVAGAIKQVTIKRRDQRWFAIFDVECEPTSLPKSVRSTGIDLGIMSFATFSDGTKVPNPKVFSRGYRKLRLAERRVARKKPGSANRKNAKRLLSEVYYRILNQRADFQHKLSATIVKTYGFIAVEELNWTRLKSGSLAGRIQDAAWGDFVHKLSYKAENAGRMLVKVNPAYTSQTCVCGALVRKTLADRWHECKSCGLSLDRDHVSAQVILQLARVGPSGDNVEISSSCVA